MFLVKVKLAISQEEKIVSSNNRTERLYLSVHIYDQNQIQDSRGLYMKSVTFFDST